MIAHIFLVMGGFIVGIIFTYLYFTFIEAGNIHSDGYEQGKKTVLYINKIKEGQK